MSDLAEVAHHEAGHAVAGFAFGVPVRHVAVAIGPQEKLDGSTDVDSDRLPPQPSAIVYLAGPAAEVLYARRAGREVRDYCRTATKPAEFRRAVRTMNYGTCPRWVPVMTDADTPAALLAGVLLARPPADLEAARGEAAVFQEDFGRAAVELRRSGGRRFARAARAWRKALALLEARWGAVEALAEALLLMPARKGVRRLPAAKVRAILAPLWRRTSMTGKARSGRLEEEAGECTPTK